MKPDFYLIRIVTRLVALLLATGLLAACGQRGPLYMPNKAEVTSAPAKPAQPDSDRNTPAAK